MVLQSSSIHYQSDQSFYRCTTFHFHFTICSHLKSFIVYQKANFELVKTFYSVYEEIPEGFLNEIDVYSYFYHNILDISQSHYRIVRVSTGSNKKSFAFKVIHFCDSKLQQRFILSKKSAFPQKRLRFYSTVWVNFSKLLIKPTKYRRFHYPNLKLRFDLQKQKKNCSVIVTRVLLSIWTDKFDWHSDLERTRLASFPSKEVWTLRWSIRSHRNCQPGLPQNQTSLQESIFCCLKVWLFWEL